MTFSVRLFNSTYVFLLMELFSQLILAIGPKLKHHICHTRGVGQKKVSFAAFIIWMGNFWSFEFIKCWRWIYQRQLGHALLMQHMKRTADTAPLSQCSTCWCDCSKCLQCVFSFSCFHPTVVECLVCIAINKSDLFPVASGPCLGCPLSLTLFIIFLSTAKYGGWAAAG